MANSVEEVIYDSLTSDSTFMSNFTGVYWQEAPEGTEYPYVVFWSVDDSGEQTHLNKTDQGRTRIQFDLWDDNLARIAQRKTTLREKVWTLNEKSGGYTITCIGISELTVPRESNTSPYHIAVDGMIAWIK